MTAARRIALWLAIACAIGIGIAQGWHQLRNMNDGPPITVSDVPEQYQGMTDRLYLEGDKLVCCMDQNKE